jgi:hypothetical protein
LVNLDFFYHLKKINVFISLKRAKIIELCKINGSPPLYSLLPLWAGDAKEGQCDKA